MNTRYFH